MGYTSVSWRCRFLEVTDSSFFDTILFTEMICIMMALMTSPILMVLPSLLVKNIVFCPEFVTDMDVGVLTGVRCSTGVDVLAGGGTVDTEGDAVVTGGATGFGARELLEMDTRDSLSF